MQVDKVVAYESKLLQNAEISMNVYEQEFLSMIHALIVWEHYLLRVDFYVQIDHQSLRYFLTQRRLFEKHMRWANFLSMFQFHIVAVQ